MSDIVERLRRQVMTDTNTPDYPRTVYINPDGPEAAAEIVRLRAERDRLRDALVLAESYSDQMGVLTVEAIRAALGDKP